MCYREAGREVTFHRACKYTVSEIKRSQGEGEVWGGKM